VILELEEAAISVVAPDKSSLKKRNALFVVMLPAGMVAPDKSSLKKRNFDLLSRLFRGGVLHQIRVR